MGREFLDRPKMANHLYNGQIVGGGMFQIIQLVQTCVLNNTDSLNEENIPFIVLSSFWFSEGQNLSVLLGYMLLTLYVNLLFNKSRINFKLTDLVQQEYLGLNISVW